MQHVRLDASNGDHWLVAEVPQDDIMNTVETEEDAVKSAKL